MKAEALEKQSNRIAAVDITRVLAAFIVMYYHLRYLGFPGKITALLSCITDNAIGTVNPIFFFFAGYFACRNISWHKAFNNALWCIIPLVIWNIITVAYSLFFVENASVYWNSLLQDGLLLKLTLNPIDGPLWFMRDLVFLFLLSPIVFKFARIIFPVLLLATFFPFSSNYILEYHGIGFSLYFFSLGCLLRTLPSDRQKQILRFYSTPLIVLYWGLAVLLTYFKTFHPDVLVGPINHNTVMETLGLWVLYQTARWIEVHWPKLTVFFIKVAPVTFLTFAAHWMIWLSIPQNLARSRAIDIIPLLTFAGLTAFFFAMKRWCRPLLHSVAHYKLRPEDL